MQLTEEHINRSRGNDNGYQEESSEGESSHASVRPEEPELQCSDSHGEPKEVRRSRNQRSSSGDEERAESSRVGSIADQLEGWWKSVRRHGRRFGVETPELPPAESMRACVSGISSYTYARTDLSRHLGISPFERRIPSPYEYETIRKCPFHFEPMIIEGHCPVEGCEQ